MNKEYQPMLAALADMVLAAGTCPPVVARNAAPRGGRWLLQRDLVSRGPGPSLPKGRGSVVAAHDLRMLIAVAFEFLPLGRREMPVPPRKYRFGAQQRLALQFVACSPLGATEAALVVNGSARQALARLIRVGLPTTAREDIKAGSQSIGRVRITEAGRQALQG